jgi:two-component system chemotaxis response regulator CheY
MATILLVEDDDILRDIIEFTLQDEGYDVVATGDSMAALDLLEARQIDLVMTDIVMPIGKPHGIAVARMARMKNGRVPLIVVTSDPDLAKEGDTLLAEVFIKPIDMDKLLETMARMLGSKGI